MAAKAQPMNDDNALGRIKVDEDGHVLLIGIDRPKKCNGFTNKMLNELAQAYTDYEAGPWRCALVDGRQGLGQRL